MKKRHTTRGFTLTELLVAFTISVAVLGTVFAVFAASNRAVRQGYQQVRGFDLARGTYDIIEADLSTAFVQREIGDKHQFFGTPIGFSFIGTTNLATGAGAASRPGIARITYVVYFGDPANPGSGQQGSGRVNIQEAFDETPQGRESFAFGQDVITYSLIRYVEPGVTDLDSWPAINGQNLWTLVARSGEELGQRVSRLLAEPIDGASDLGYSFLDFRNEGPGGVTRRTQPPTPEQQLLQDARKRELWIRMLGGDPTLPNLWQLLDANDPTRRITPRDFVVAESIFLPADLIPLIPVFNDPEYAFFQYGTAQRQPLVQGGFVSRDEARLLTTGELRLREGLPAERWHLYWMSAYNLKYDRSNLQDPRQLGAIASGQFLTRNQAFGSTGLANDLGITLTELSERSNRDPSVPQVVNPYSAQDIPGTPYDPTLPDNVHIRFEYLLESPWAGVPEFRRKFDQIIDLPTGYSRKAPPVLAGG